MKKLYIVVLNYNGFENSKACINTVLKSRVPQGFLFKTVVVDNASKDGSGEMLKKEFPDITILLNSKNLGYSGGNNVGIEYALSHDAAYILILNNDTIVLRESIYEMIMAMRAENFDVVCPKIYFEKGFEYHKDSYRKEDLGKVFWFAGGEMDWKNVIGHHKGVDQVDRGQFDHEKYMMFLTGACFLAKSEIFNKVGLFQDKYFLYYEDADLSVRLKKKGFKIGLASRSVIYHKNAGSTGGSGSGLQDYFITRNRLLFGMRYASVRAKTALLREAMRLFLHGRKWQKKGVQDFFLNRFGKGSYPVS